MPAVRRISTLQDLISQPWLGILFLLFLPVAAQAQFVYTIKNAEVTITGYTGPGGAVVIPETLDGLPVVRIENWAFAANAALSSIVVPGSVLVVGDHAFSECPGLVSVVLEEGVKSVGQGAFESCGMLTSLTIPESTGVLGSSAFSGCWRLTEVSLPGAITEISAGLFNTCTSLKAMNIPSGVTSIGSYAFSGCYRLATVAVPGSVTRIEQNAFADCFTLNGITLPAGLTNLGESAFSSCVALTSITIPAGIHIIPGDTFGSCYRLTSVMIPEGVTEIGHYAFVSCHNMLEITIPGSVTRIGNSAFSGCRALTMVTLPRSLAVLEAFAFSYCENLSAITVEEPNPAYSSQDGVLFNEGMDLLIQYPAAKMGEYTIPSTVVRIEDYAFLRSIGLTALTIPASVVSLNEEFELSQCRNLAAITVLEPNPAYTSRDGVLFNEAMDHLILYPESKSGHYTIPDTVTAIPEGTFYRHDKLTSVSIPPGLPAGVYREFGNSLNLEKIYLSRDAPDLPGDTFRFSAKATIYYAPGAAGWGATLGGRPAFPWEPRMAAPGAAGGVFGFDVAGDHDFGVVVEATDDLSSSGWERAGTLELTNGAATFSEALSPPRRVRFYRLRMP